MKRGLAGLDGVGRIWLGHDNAVGVTRLFRRRFEVRDPQAVRSADLVLFAESSYHVWINGRYLGRGPTFSHPHRRSMTRHDVRRHLRRGRNVLAVLVHAVGLPLHNHIPSGCPGLVARLDLVTRNGRATIRTDGRWRATSRTGWLEDGPRRSWAIGFVEHFDAAMHPWGWQSVAFDDSRWPQAEARPAFKPGRRGEYLDPGLPGLRFQFVPAQKLLQVRATGQPLLTLSRELPRDAYGSALLAERWSQPRRFRTGRRVQPRTGGLAVQGLDGREHAVLCLDLGAQYTGHVCFRMRCESAGTVEIGWAEVVEKGRPQVLRKQNTYVDRYEACAGRNEWMPIGFSSGRYLLVILRGFRGRVVFDRLGMQASEPGLAWTGSFRSSNPRLNRIFDLCARTLRVGTQEGLMDCPTREQAAYVGDGNPTAAWIARMTGDFSHWRHLIRETFAVRSASGLIKDTVFSGSCHALLDYDLLAVSWLRDYLWETQDVVTVREVLPACRRLIRWFERRTDRNGLFVFDWERRATGGFPAGSRLGWKPGPAWVTAPAAAETPLRRPEPNVFIDHPGMGWHNVGEPGIDRRGCNAAMNALLAMAYRDLADLMHAAGVSGAARYRHKASRLARTCERFWSQAAGAYVDGIRRGKRLRQVSQQTNTWCIMAGITPAERRRRIMERVLRESDRALARSGPYFWTFMFPVLAHLGMHREALHHTERLWGRMLEHGATTLWETFSGDGLDSYCHPWSGAPLEFLLRHVAGIGSFHRQLPLIGLRPRLDLVDRVDACGMTVRGAVRIAWRKEGGRWVLSGSLPPGVRARIQLPTGELFERDGHWTFRV